MMIDLSCVVFTGWYVPYQASICTSSLQKSAGSEFAHSAQRETPFWYILAKGHWEVIACICVHHEQFTLFSVAEKDLCFLRLARMGSNMTACSLHHLQAFLTPLAHQPIQHGELTACFCSSCALIQWHLCSMKAAVSDWFLFACLSLTSFTLYKTTQ